MKGTQKRMSTKHEISCMCVLGKQVIVGTMGGQLLFYSIVDGQLMVEVNAHARQVTALASAFESSQVTVYM
ncbi:hypothetical protein AB6A40_009704 [Gnathostoma spinigerum]|uniref:Uncharacterized protein n=1 Tax=Gnathostoma spinigerum TaxID=75299 RepID=A0ABD6F207_9BILA